MLVDDGQGYIDMGLDNFFELDENGDIMEDSARAWMYIDGQPVSYYHVSTVKDGKVSTTIGRVPALLNGEKANLIIIFDSEHPKGYLAGANTEYEQNETEAIAKNITEIKSGDVIDFLADYYNYDGEFVTDYKIGEQYTVSKTPEVYYTTVEEDNLITYKLTDIYNNSYWTPTLKNR